MRWLLDKWLLPGKALRKRCSGGTKDKRGERHIIVGRHRGVLKISCYSRQESTILEMSLLSWLVMEDKTLLLKTGFSRD
jgi:hypothetical protein